ncbi:MAG TPA: hypothetical protein VF914_04895 [Chloroflexia bacterium]
MPGSREWPGAACARTSGEWLRRAVRAARSDAVAAADGTVMPIEAVRAVRRRGAVLSGGRSGAGSRVQNCCASDEE